MHDQPTLEPISSDDIRHSRSRNHPSIKTQLHFVFEKSVSRSVRDEELENATRKSHAAWVSHFKRKQPTMDKVGTAPKILLSRSRSQNNDDWQADDEPARPSSPVLLHGNSDPFTTTALAVTPEINRILTFMRDEVLPAIYSTDILRRWSADAISPINLMAPPHIISFRAAYGDWEQQISCLQDEGMALAGLSAWCYLLPSLDASRTRVKSPLINSFQMRARSSVLLSKRLQKERSIRSLNKNSVLHIFWLFRSEAISGNREAARIHGDQLRVIVKHAFENGAVGFQCLIQFLFVDVDLATTCMQRTMLDVEVWFVEVLGPLWARGRSILPPLNAQVYLGLSDTVDVELLVSTTAASAGVTQLFMTRN
jgi:hypothetical protein